MNRVILSLHSLAALRHFDVEPARISITLSLALSDGADGRPNPGESGFAADKHSWAARVHLGNGKWGHAVGEGRTPEEALIALHAAYLSAHKAMDGVRAQAFSVAQDLDNDARVGAMISRGVASAASEES